MQNLRNVPLTAFVLALLAIALGCGQFFPGATSITSLAIAPQNTTVAPGVTQQYSATATYGNNTTGDVTSSVSLEQQPHQRCHHQQFRVAHWRCLRECHYKGSDRQANYRRTGVTVTSKQVTSVTIAPLQMADSEPSLWDRIQSSSPPPQPTKTERPAM